MDHPSRPSAPDPLPVVFTNPVLSTMTADGSRRWLRPRPSSGKFAARRRILAYALIALYTALPFVRVGGQPAMLFDVSARRFTVFGFTFLPTDTVLLALTLVTIFVAIFLVTALWGRVWCGWACPQTVYMEFIFRPIERLFEGTRGRGGNPRVPPSTARKLGKYAVYFVICFVLANTFLAYFVGVETLGQWMVQSPFEHPVPFLIMAFVTGLMMFDFAYFREQMCTLACPYGRLQSVLLDRNSVIIAYDAARGEPRGPVRKGGASRSLPVLGDCVDCRMCVQTCPTGIDIREGLQMECVSCAQCIDACDRVMEKVGRPKGLIRYSSQARDAGEGGKLLRARTIAYPLVLVVLAGALVFTLLGRQSFDAVLLRNTGQPFTVTEDGRVRNVMRLKLTNRASETLSMSLALPEADGTGMSLEADHVALEPGEVETIPLTVVAPLEAFDGGQLHLSLEVRADDGSTRALEGTLLGPRKQTGP